MSRIKVGMLGYINRSFSSLSVGGEKNKDNSCKSFSAKKTECLILDEPTNHFRYKVSTAIYGLLLKNLV